MIDSYFGRRVLILAAATAVIPLASCTAAGEPITGPVDDTATSTSTPTATTSDADTTDLAFNAVMKQYGLPSGPKAIDTAHATCDALDRGVTATQVATIAIESFGNPTDAGRFLGAAVSAYCPEYSDDLANVGGGDPA